MSSVISPTGLCKCLPPVLSSFLVRAALRQWSHLSAPCRTRHPFSSPGWMLSSPLSQADSRYHMLASLCISTSLGLKCDPENPLFFLRWGYAPGGGAALEPEEGLQNMVSPWKPGVWEISRVSKGTGSSDFKVFRVLSRGPPLASQPPSPLPTYRQADDSLVAVMFW